jgi:hypothetical protein
VFLAQIAIERGVAGDLRVQVLNVVGRSCHDAAVRFDDAHITEVHGLSSRLKWNCEHSPVLYAGVGIQAHAGGLLTGAIALVIKGNFGGHPLEDKRLL